MCGFLSTISQDSFASRVLISSSMACQYPSARGPFITLNQLGVSAEFALTDRVNGDISSNNPVIGHMELVT